MTSEIRARWAVVTTHANGERIACEHLQRQEFNAYCPMIRKRRSHARKVEMVLRPLFPGYLFVHIDPGAQVWRPILSTRGVRTLLRVGEAPAFLDPDFIDGLKAREENGAIMPAASLFRVGQKVRVEGGPLDGLIAEILALNDQERITVLLDVMNRGVKAVIDRRQLAPLSKV